jgi:SAM-dependent methyltransferase
MSPPPDALRGVLGLEPLGWMMAPSERLAIVGLLAILRPRRSLELGCAEGRLTEWLSAYSERVVTVDLDPRVHEVTRHLANVTALCTSTEAAASRIEAEGTRFDLTVVDADHSADGVRRDLERALRFSDVILLHDAYHPPCRAGIEAVLADRDVYRDLDLVPGGLQPDGLWGGLGIVIPSLPRATVSHVTPRASTFPALRRRWLAGQWAARPGAALRRLARRR